MSRITEVEAYASSVNVAAASAGAIASASTSYSSAYGPNGVVNGDRDVDRG